MEFCTLVIVLLSEYEDVVYKRSMTGYVFAMAKRNFATSTNKDADTTTHIMDSVLNLSPLSGALSRHDFPFSGLRIAYSSPSTTVALSDNPGSSPLLQRISPEMQPGQFLYGRRTSTNPNLT